MKKEDRDRDLELDDESELPPTRPDAPKGPMLPSETAEYAPEGVPRNLTADLMDAMGQHAMAKELRKPVPPPPTPAEREAKAAAGKPSLTDRVVRAKRLEQQRRQEARELEASRAAAGASKAAARARSR